MSLDFKILGLVICIGGSLASLIVGYYAFVIIPIVVGLGLILMGIDEIIELMCHIIKLLEKK